MASRRATGLARMRALAADLPDGLLAGFRAGRELELPNGRRLPATYAFGMGGSAIAADLVRGVVDAEGRVPLLVVRSSELPRSMPGDARALLVSYSGETWETLRAYRAAGRAGVDRVVVTSGGTLADRAESDGVPVLRVPPGLPSRAAIGPLLGGLLGVLDPTFPESNEGRVARICDRLRPEIGRYSRERGPAVALARSIGDRMPCVIAEAGFEALARRWKTQFEENAKRRATYEAAPELFHNSVEGWSGTPRAHAEHSVAVLLEWAGGDPTVRRGFREVERLLRSKAVPSVRVRLAAKDRLEAVVDGIALGDQVTLRLAEHGGVDPLPVPAVARLRRLLADTPAPA